MVMSNKVNAQTESIEVPVAYAGQKEKHSFCVKYRKHQVLKRISRASAVRESKWEQQYEIRSVNYG